MATNEEANESSTEHEQVDTPAIMMKMSKEPTEAEVKAEDAGDDFIIVKARENLHTNMDIIMSNEDARELVTEIEDAIATETK